MRLIWLSAIKITASSSGERDVCDLDSRGLFGSIQISKSFSRTGFARWDRTHEGECCRHQLPALIKGREFHTNTANVLRRFISYLYIPFDHALTAERRVHAPIPLRHFSSIQVVARTQRT